jgi:hypothetical protein
MIAWGLEPELAELAAALVNVGVGLGLGDLLRAG